MQAETEREGQITFKRIYTSCSTLKTKVYNRSFICLERQSGRLKLMISKSRIKFLNAIMVWRFSSSRHFNVKLLAIQKFLQDSNKNYLFQLVSKFTGL